jgi:hypothetical protein
VCSLVETKAAILVSCAAIGDARRLLKLHLDYSILSRCGIGRESHKDLGSHSLLHCESCPGTFALIRA